MVIFVLAPFLMTDAGLIIDGTYELYIKKLLIDKVIMNNLDVSCIDLLKYDSLIDQKQLDSEGETITTKIKNLFRQYMEKGGNQ